jgi:hypothetical protein
MSSATASVRPRRIPRALIWAAAAGAVALLIAVLLGRHERSEWAARQMRGMERIAQEVGPLDQPSLVGYRVLPEFDCLVYRRGAEQYAVELCFDASGRLVEAIDRRPRDSLFYSVRADPSASTIVVDRARIDRLLRKMGASIR